MTKFHLSGRTSAMLGVGTATAAAAMVAFAGPALAAGTQLTSCTDQVRVRSQPSSSAPVIGTCKAGEKVTVDETRNGFVHLVNKKGWASADYVAVRRDRDDRNRRGDRDDDRDDNGRHHRDNDRDYYNHNDHDSNGVLGGF
ncbi:MAG TPA: SH3 domain-containing protein [Pseudonocardia sp.]|jgi:uncharacterized protein YgiM (DUF1202 family)